MANLREKHFKEAIIIAFNVIKQSILKIKEQIWNLYRNYKETIKKIQFEIPQLKSKWNKKYLVRLNRRNIN